MVIARAIISDIGSYYSVELDTSPKPVTDPIQVWRCDEMLYLTTNQTAAQALYPQCFGVDPSTVSVAVHASLKEDVINLASAVRVTMGMSLWVATLLHGIGVEIYVSSVCLVRRHLSLGPPSDQTNRIYEPQQVWLRLGAKGLRWRRRATLDLRQVN